VAVSDWTIVRRSVTGRMFSSVTTVLMVGVSVGLMLTLLSMRRSGERAFERGSGDMHMLISNDSSPMVSVLNGIFYANAPANFIPWATYEGLRASYPFEYAVPTQLGDSFRGRPVMATTREFFTAFSPDAGSAWRVAQGDLFDGAFQVVLGAEAARATGLAIGDRINVFHGAPRDQGAHAHAEYDYEVVGILAPTGGPHDRALFTDLTSAWILHAHDRRALEPGGAPGLTTEADLTDADRKITGVYAKLASRGGGAPAALPQVLAQLRARPDVIVAQPRGEIQRLFGIVSNIDQVLLGMAAVVMVSSAAAIMLTLYNAMEQRRRQVAVLRVLGASKGRIFGLVMTESALLGLLGGAVGIALAWAGGRAVAAVMWARLGLVIEAGLEARIALAVAMGAVALAALAGVAPAVAGYRTSVARNLRPIG